MAETLSSSQVSVLVKSAAQALVAPAIDGMAKAQTKCGLAGSILASAYTDAARLVLSLASIQQDSAAESGLSTAIRAEIEASPFSSDCIDAIAALWESIGASVCHSLSTGTADAGEIGYTHLVHQRWDGGLCLASDVHAVDRSAAVTGTLSLAGPGGPQTCTLRLSQAEAQSLLASMDAVQRQLDVLAE